LTAEPDRLDLPAGSGDARPAVPELTCRVAESLDEVSAEDWNRIAATGQPFLRHEFLAALEHTDCVGDDAGWYPRHLLFHAGDVLVAAAPMYLKTHSYGEFVFDWSWADAYARAGLDYYPKLVSAIPFTPVAGPRLLLDTGIPSEPLRRAVAAAALEVAERSGVSSVHWLFTEEADTHALDSSGFLIRTGCQFHWPNPGFRDFQDYLDGLRSKKRKQIRRERREAARSGLDIELLSGSDLSDSQCDAYHDLYASTYDRKWGYPSLSREFFYEVRRSMGDSFLLVLARNAGRYVAGAHLFRGQKRIYGRNWGCSEYHRSVHFEMCYYKPIEYCIEHGLDVFEAGAQGEHKLSRGFLPVLTRSAHGILHPAFRRAVGEFLSREHLEIRRYAAEMTERSPFRDADSGRRAPEASSDASD
jgi:predicted N-acyltransferase